MWMPVELRFVLNMSALGIAFVALGRALIWIPLLVLDWRTILCGLLGLYAKYSREDQPETKALKVTVAELVA